MISIKFQRVAMWCSKIICTHNIKPNKADNIMFDIKHNKNTNKESKITMTNPNKNMAYVFNRYQKKHK